MGYSYVAVEDVKSGLQQKCEFSNYSPACNKFSSKTCDTDS